MTDGFVAPLFEALDHLLHGVRRHGRPVAEGLHVGALQFFDVAPEALDEVRHPLLCDSLRERGLDAHPPGLVVVELACDGGCSLDDDVHPLFHVALPEEERGERVLLALGEFQRAPLDRAHHEDHPVDVLAIPDVLRVAHLPEELANLTRERVVGLGEGDHLIAVDLVLRDIDVVFEVRLEGERERGVALHADALPHLDLCHHALLRVVPGARGAEDAGREAGDDAVDVFEIHTVRVADSARIAEDLGALVAEEGLEDLEAVGMGRHRPDRSLAHDVRGALDDPSDVPFSIGDDLAITAHEELDGEDGGAGEDGDLLVEERADHGNAFVRVAWTRLRQGVTVAGFSP